MMKYYAVTEIKFDITIPALSEFMALASLANIRLGWKKLGVDKHSSLLQIFVNYGRKKFYNIRPWRKCYETFYFYKL